MMPLAFAGTAAHFVPRWGSLLLLLDLAAASADAAAIVAALRHMWKSCEVLNRLAFLHEVTRCLVLHGLRLVDQQQILAHEQHIPMQLMNAARVTRVNVPLNSGQVHGSQA